MRHSESKSPRLGNAQIMHGGLAKYSRRITRTFDLLGEMKHPVHLHPPADQIPVKIGDIFPGLEHFRLVDAANSALLRPTTASPRSPATRPACPEHALARA